MSIKYTLDESGVVWFPLVLLQAKAVSWKEFGFSSYGGFEAVSISSPSSEGGEWSPTYEDYYSSLFPLVLLQAKAVRGKKILQHSFGTKDQVSISSPSSEGGEVLVIPHERLN